MEALIWKGSLQSNRIDGTSQPEASHPLSRLSKGTTSGQIKILFIIDFFYGLKHGGTENQVWKLISHLNRDIYDVHLLVLRGTEWIAEHGKKLNCAIETFDIVKLKNPRNIKTFFQITHRIREISPDIAITFFPLSNILGVVAAKISRVSTIISTRRDYGLWLNWLFKGDLFFLKLANKCTNGVIVNAACIKELTHTKEDFDRSKIHIIYNGIDADGFRSAGGHAHGIKTSLGIPIRSAVVGIVANLSQMKRHETFLWAAQKVLRDRPDTHFILVGDGPRRGMLEDIVTSLGIERHIHFAGAHDNVIPFLDAFTIGINCSANEGLSNAIMEYMASGIPCIVSDAGGNRELVQNDVNGYVFQLDNHEQLAARILDLLEDPEKQKEFAKKSREIITTQFTLERMIAGYDNYFTQSLLNGHNTKKKREQ